MLGHKRPAGSKTERRFIRSFIAPLGAKPDAFGNHVLRIGDAPVMWSCHTDSVHKEGGKQLVEVSHGIASLARGSTSNCLGADDAAGVWLMREMILARRPGLYVFHRAEECGGQGSDYIARRNPALLDGIRYVVAFDRRGYGDVITHQAMGRCASDAFASSLADQLGKPYAPCDTGVFTDTANYVDLIGECSNISVGYDCEHSKGETLNVSHLVELREALLTLDASRLEYERAPGDVDIEDDWDGRAYGSTGSHWERTTEPRRLTGLCRDYPDLVAEVLSAYGITAEEIEDEIFAQTGMVRRPFKGGY
jgi:hypothetical protein